jgi:hypothetical protein
MAAQGVARGVQRVGIDDCEHLGQRAFAGQGQGLGNEGGAAFLLRLQQAADGGDETGRPDRRGAGGDGGRGVEDQLRGEALAGLPGVERVGFVRQQQGQFVGRVGVVEDDRRREVSQQRRHRPGVEAVEVELLHRFGEEQCFLGAGNHPAGGVEKRDAQRDQVGMVVAGAAHLTACSSACSGRCRRRNGLRRRRAACPAVRTSA